MVKMFKQFDHYNGSTDRYVYCVICPGHQLPHGLGDRPGLPGAERRGAGEAAGGVEGGAEEDRGGDPHPQAGPHRQGEARSRWAAVLSPITPIVDYT